MQIYFEIKNFSSPLELAEIEKGLIAYNHACVGKFAHLRFGIFARNTHQQLLAGLEGLITLSWLYIENLWVSDAVRGQGIGKKMMEQAEDKAKAMGCHYAHLETGDFQAQGFYQKLGYEVFSVLEDYPPGHQNFFMKKSL